MLLSQTCRHGLRAVLHLASEGAQGGNYISISSVSRELNISFHYLTKILQQLTQAGILTSNRGRGGGVAFARDPAQLTPYDIVVILEGPELFKSCVLGLGACSDAHPCPLHTKWVHTRAHMQEMFGSTNLQQLAQRVHQTDLRLAD